ncbi:hypothetical protein Taro_038647 [Colocasia esculenta]|uniref:Uncharacterized protein n=1 Tax=Colocasia esculenta TaxID=4460 RepID=A0A843WDE4_COLES|nr:hypothetical protein [Colocasia esculenta]
MRIFIHPRIRTAREAQFGIDTLTRSHYVTVDRALVSQNSISGPKFRHEACVLVQRLSYPLGRTWIFVCPEIRTARKAPIQNRHFDAIGKRSHSEISGLAPKFSLGAWSWAADAIVYRHPFARTGITFRSVIRIAYKTPIRNWYSEMPVAPLLPQACRNP